MKKIKFFYVFLLLISFSINFAYAQLNDATVTISGSTSICPGDHVYTLQISAQGENINDYVFIWKAPPSGCFVSGGNCLTQLGDLNNGVYSTSTTVTIRWPNTSTPHQIRCELYKKRSGGLIPLPNATSAFVKTSDPIAIRALGNIDNILINGVNTSTLTCGATPVTISVPAVVNATSYTWSMPAGWSGNGTVTSTPSITVTPSIAGGGTISVTARRSDCPNLTTQNFKTITRPTPIANPPQATNYTLCANNSQQVTVTGTNATAINWTATNGFTVSNIVNTINGNNVSSTATVTAPAAGSDADGTITATAFSPACGSGSSTSVSLRSIGSSPTTSLLSLSGAGMTVTQGGLSLAAILQQFFYFLRTQLSVD
jgi:hypothetical protein